MRISDWSSDVCSSDLGNPHFGPFHLLSFAFIGGGFILIASAWKTLYVAQRDGVLATTGTYGSIRHPQYLGFILVMFGFLLQWPTLLTLLMFPVLVVMYVRLARDRQSTRLNSSHSCATRMPSSA